MAFAAIHPEAGRIDATLPDLGCGLAWGSAYKVRPRIALRCPECGHGVHAKLSPFKLRYFAHDPGHPADCSWLNESLEHHLLKLELATAIRTVGWHAQMEVRAADGTWRADVLAFSADGTRRVAREGRLHFQGPRNLPRSGQYANGVGWSYDAGSSGIRPVDTRTVLSLRAYDQYEGSSDGDGPAD